MKTGQEAETLLEESQARSAKSIARFVRIPPRKVRLVIDTIRRRPVSEAFSVLMTLNKKAARLAEKVLKSAVANAKVLGMAEDRLYVSDVRADGGPSLKRFMSRSMGRADRILKRTTHLSIVLKEGNKKMSLPVGEAQAADEAEGKEKGKGLKLKIPFVQQKKKAASAAG